MTFPSPDQAESRYALLTPTYTPAALATPWYRRRRFLKWAAIAMAIIVAISALYAWRDIPGLWKWSRLQRPCLTYSAPADRVVYSEIPADVATLQGTDAQYSLVPYSNPPAITFVPTCWINFPVWQTGRNDPVVYLGERTTGQGQKRLVCVIFTGWGGKFTPGAFKTGAPGFDVLSIGVANLRNPPLAMVWRSNGIRYAAQPPPSLRLKFFAGQPDAGDGSRFTIPYELNGQRGTIEGVLGARETDFSMTISDGPLKDIYRITTRR